MRETKRMPHLSSIDATGDIAEVLRKAVGSADTGLLLLDRNLRAVYLNQAFIDMWTVPPALAVRPHSLERLARHEAAICGELPPECGRFSAAQRQDDIRAGPVPPAIIDLPDGRHIRFSCTALADGHRLLAYCDITPLLKRRVTEAQEMLQAELRYTNETLESQAAYLASLAEAAEESAHRAEISRIMLEREIEERRQLEVQLREMATTDGLTGALNRAAFLVAAERELEKARRFGTPLAVLMLDADHFKSINDRFGHAGGDMALREIVMACQKCLRSGDLIGRMGGEEFVIVLPGAPPHAAEAAAERLRSAVAGLSLPLGDGSVTLTISLGVTMLMEGDTAVEQVIARADAALYEAKKSGRNRVIRRAA